MCVCMCLLNIDLTSLTPINHPDDSHLVWRLSIFHHRPAGVQGVLGSQGQTPHPPTPLPLTLTDSSGHTQLTSSHSSSASSHSQYLTNTDERSHFLLMASSKATQQRAYEWTGFMIWRRGFLKEALQRKVVCWHAKSPLIPVKRPQWRVISLPAPLFSVLLSADGLLKPASPRLSEHLHECSRIL